MNRRDLLKGILGLATLIPFISWKKKNAEPVILGIDKALPESDETFYQIYISQGSTPLPLSEIKDFEGFFHATQRNILHVNCACELVEINTLSSTTTLHVND